MEIDLGIIVLAGYALYFAARLIFRYRVDFLLYAIIGLHFLSMVARTLELQHFPIIGIADTFCLLSFILMLFCAYGGIFSPGLIPGLTALVFLCISVVFYLTAGEAYVREELKTALLPLHVIPAILGYAFYTVGFLGSAANILGGIFHKQRLEKLGNFSLKANLIGNVFFGTGALVIGSVWAYVAWGSFWDWDVKETFSLVTFLVYSVYLFLGYKKKLDGMKLSFLCVASYSLLIFTYVGVTFLIQGRHSYR